MLEHIVNHHYAAEQVAEYAELIDDDQSTPPPALFACTDTRIQLRNDVLSTLQHQIMRQEFNTWIRPTTLHAIEEGIATIVVPNVLVKEAIEARYVRCYVICSPCMSVRR